MERQLKKLKKAEFIKKLKPESEKLHEQKVFFSALHLVNKISANRSSNKKKFQSLLHELKTMQDERLG